MVRQPARAAQLTFEHDAATGASLDDVLCDAARASPDALPLLQYCLDELYRQRGDDGTLRFDVFRQLGGIEGALGVRAEQVVAKLPAQQQAALPHVLSLLINIGDEQSAVTARRTPWAALDSEAKRELVRALVEARLFVSELTGDVPTFGVAHEALLRRWPRVVEWIERHRQALQIRTRVAAQAERWAAAGRPRDLLLPEGTQANQARGLLEIADLALSSQEKDYVDASLRRARLGSRIRFAAMAIIGLLAVLAAVLGLTARSAQQEAEQRRADAESLMSFMLGDFVDKLRPLGRLDLLDDVSAKALTYLSGAATDSSTSSANAQRVKTLQLIAEVGTAQGRHAAASDALRAAEQILQRQLAAGHDELPLLKAAGANAFWLGKLSFDRGEWSRAEQYMLRYRDFSARIVNAMPNDLDGWMELSYAHNSYGSALLRQDKLPAAAAAFAHSVELKQRVLSRQPERPGIAVDLANAISWLASTKVKLGQLREAMRLFQQEEALLIGAHNKEPTNAVWAQKLSSSIWRKADLLQAFGDASAGAAYERAAQLILQPIQRDPTNKLWQRHAASIRLRQLAEAGDTDSAAALAVHQHLQQLRDQSPDAREVQHLLAKASEQLARSYLRKGNASLASITLQQAVEIYQQLRSGALDRSVDASYARTLLLTAEIQLAQGSQNAKQTCRAAIEALDPARRGSDYLTLVPLVEASLCAGEAKAALDIMARLESMGYRDARYLKNISKYKSEKGNT
ncbi:transcriptional regulator [Massilia sp. YMA4]|uniref:nSTAND1 domain-containing NTPase n=1 Tax=Massilia sp. YMA4 TaxID=1593482 RepID=UPI0026C74D89